MTLDWTIAVLAHPLTTLAVGLGFGLLIGWALTASHSRRVGSPAYRRQASRREVGRERCWHNWIRVEARWIRLTDAQRTEAERAADHNPEDRPY